MDSISRSGIFLLLGKLKALVHTCMCVCVHVLETEIRGLQEGPKTDLRAAAMWLPYSEDCSEVGQGVPWEAGKSCGAE